MNEEIHKNIRIPGRRLLTEKETALYLGMSRSFLRQSRMNGNRDRRVPAPPFRRFSSRCIRYELDDLNKWIEQFEKVGCTSTLIK